MAILLLLNKLMKVRFFDPGRSYRKIKGEIDAEMQRVLTSGDLILRKDVEDFESNLAQIVGTRFAVGVASGTDALILTLKALGITGKVLVPSYTFRATIEAVVHAGATPVLYDLDGPTFSSDIQAWIPAHIAGEVMFNFAAKVKEAEAQGITVVEDACQAITAYPVCGIAAAYSFYPAKLLGCYGDGGGIATNDAGLYEKLKIMRNHFKGDWGPVGYNSRLDNLQAAVLNVKIKYLHKEIRRRKQIAEMYDAELKNVGKPEVRGVYQDYIITHPNRDELYQALAVRGVETMLNGYPFPEITPKLPKAKAYEESSLRIPIYGDLNDHEVHYVINKINEVA